MGESGWSIRDFPYKILRLLKKSRSGLNHDDSGHAVNRLPASLNDGVSDESEIPSIIILILDAFRFALETRPLVSGSAIDDRAPLIFASPPTLRANRGCHPRRLDPLPRRRLLSLRDLRERDPLDFGHPLLMGGRDFRVAAKDAEFATEFRNRHLGDGCFVVHFASDSGVDLGGIGVHCSSVSRLRYRSRLSRSSCSVFVSHLSRPSLCLPPT